MWLRIYRTDITSFTLSLTNNCSCKVIVLLFASTYSLTYFLQQHAHTETSEYTISVSDDSLQ
jgi:hypothetical protein